jgi:predicted DNA-binding transcriptional regulator AlpA
MVMPSGMTKTREGAMRYLGFRDLLQRWVYTRQGLYGLIARDDFPPPAFTINQGRTKVWELSAIEAYERQHPEVTSEAAKRYKTTGYFLTLLKGTKGKETAN